MTGEANLTTLLRSMRPELHADPYGFAVADPHLQTPSAFARITEAEGVTVIAVLTYLAEMRLAATASWARISLTVHSDLAAVGLTATLAHALAKIGITANVVAGFYHDHIFVPWERRHDALTALERLSDV